MRPEWDDNEERFEGESLVVGASEEEIGFARRDALGYERNY